MASKLIKVASKDAFSNLETMTRGPNYVVTRPQHGGLRQAVVVLWNCLASTMLTKLVFNSKAKQELVLLQTSFYGVVCLHVLKKKSLLNKGSHFALLKSNLDGYVQLYRYRFIDIDTCGGLWPFCI